MKLLGTALVIAALGCGGNYSNEDVDYQLALPEREDLVAKLPNALEAADAAEYYRLTRGVIRTFGGIVDAFLGLVDAVRAFPPTTRKPGQRTWGPFPAEHAPGWEVRMVVDRMGPEAAPSRFVYALEFRRARDAAAAWQPIIQGWYAPDGGARRGRGELHLITTGARGSGYPLKDLEAVESLDIDHDRRAFPVRVKANLLTRRPVMGQTTLEQTTYDYDETEDGSGALLSTFPIADGGASLELRSRWAGSGAGRGDVKIDKGSLRGTDCWGIDTRATYSFRDGIGGATAGTVASCVFPAP